MEFTVDLPARAQRGRTDWETVVEQCKRNRGMYGLVGKFSISMASQVRRGIITAFLPRPSMDLDERVEWMRLNWQIEYRRNPDYGPDQVDLYVRYIG